ncbi:L-lactate MFS transporter [Gudongella sp. SC589]|uniref:L-lactate MFS transporter n=1 Tax=Gudongella sp. SC589 TaxID=3385990 RepID=UPI0039048C99
MKKSKDYSRHKVLWAAVTLNFISGLIYMWSVISKALIENHGFSSKQASLPYTAFTISFVIAMVVFGKLQDTKGPRAIASLGVVLMGSGLILSGMFMSPVWLVLTMGIITGTGIGIINASTSPPVVKWYPPERKGKVLGIVVAGAGLSSTLYSPLTNKLINGIGVEKTFIYIGLAALFASAVLAQFLRNPPKVYQEGSSNINKQMHDSFDIGWRDMVCTPGFYKLWLMLGLSASAGLMIIGHITNIAKVQAGWEGGFLLVILISIFNTAGRIIAGRLSDRMGRVNLMKMVFGIQALNMLLFQYYSTPGTLAIGVAVTGACYGAAFPLFPSIVTDIYGLNNFGINYGLVYTGWGLGGTIGPMVAAVMFDSLSSYRLAFVSASVLMIMALGIAATFNPAREGRLKAIDA